ncbi:MAG TPA: response regulator transcription factor [Bacteroidia bacterium]|nr:response regulator transcription factor [Bacteroidia bacterium]
MYQLKIIITDDHQLFRQGLESLLRKIPIISKIKHASNGEETLELLKKEIFDVVMMDIRMPVMNGIEATKEISKKYPKVRIMALTMMQDRSSIVKMFKAGASGYILKNTSFKEVEDALTQIINGKKYYAKEVSDTLLENLIDLNPEKKRGPYKGDLTQREKEIVKLMCQSFSSKEIADMLNITENTIESHRVHIYNKLEIETIVDLVFYALDNGLVIKPEQ